MLLLSLPLAGCGDGLLDVQGPALAVGAGADGRNVALAGTGLALQPAILAVNVPVTDAGDIIDARLRWTGRASNPTGDDTIVVNGVEHTGNLLASYSVGGDLPWVFFYELDASGIVGPGNNILFVSGVNLDDSGPSRPSGIGAFVTYADPLSPWTVVQVLDPREFVHSGSPGFETGSVWSVPVGAAADPRWARFVLFAGDCQLASSDEIWWETGTGAAPPTLAGIAQNMESGQLRAAQGDRMDVYVKDLEVPAGHSRFDYQLVSPSGDGDEILHFLGALCIEGGAAACVGSISGSVWHDADGDGIRDAGDDGMGGVPVRLRDAGGALVASADTDADGSFSFDDLCAGMYDVEVDDAAMAGYVPSTCGTASCSPQVVELAADDGSVTDLSFGWTVADTPACLLSLGRWKHQISMALGANGGKPLMTAGELEMLLATVHGNSAVDWSGGDGILDPEDAGAVLSVPGGSASCRRAEPHYLVMLLNHAWNGAVDARPVDTTGDGGLDSTFGEAIAQCGAMLLDGDCAEAAALAKAVNSMPSADCSY